MTATGAHARIHAELGCNHGRTTFAATHLLQRDTGLSGRLRGGPEHHAAVERRLLIPPHAVI